MRRWGMGFCLILVGGLAACARKPLKEQVPEELRQAELVVYTTQEESLYLPLVREFEERMDLRVEVEQGTAEELLRRVAETGNSESLPWDVVFGVGIGTLEQIRDRLEPYESTEVGRITETFQCEDNVWTGFSAQPFVIMYNINVVTYRELPVGWRSLLEPRFKGRVAFADPMKSEIYGAALTTAVCADQAAGQDGEDYIKRLMENLEGRVLTGFSEVNEGIVDGRYSLGVTMEQSAQALMREGADVDYIYPEEGTAAIPDGTSVVSGCEHPGMAKQFVDFTVSKDVQRLLASNLNRRPVRSDVLPLADLWPISRITFLDMEPEKLVGELSQIRTRWEACHTEREEDER